MYKITEIISVQRMTINYIVLGRAAGQSTRIELFTNWLFMPIIIIKKEPKTIKIIYYYFFWCQKLTNAKNTQHCMHPGNRECIQYFFFLSVKYFKMTWPLDHLPLSVFADRCVVAIERQNKITTSDRIIFVSHVSGFTISRKKICFSLLRLLLFFIPLFD